MGEKFMNFWHSVFMCYSACGVFNFNLCCNILLVAQAFFPDALVQQPEGSVF